MPSLSEHVIMATAALLTVLGLYRWAWGHGWRAGRQAGEALGYDRGYEAAYGTRSDKAIAEHIARLKCRQRQQQGYAE